MSGPALTRRQALQAGAALCIAFRLDRAAAQAAPAAPTDFRPNAWLRLEPNGAVTVLISMTEMGQGIATGVGMIVADELDADWDRVTVRTVEPDGKRFMITGGSYSTSASWVSGRKAAAAARWMLLQAGAQALGAEPADCRTEKHAVVHPASGRRVGYGELALRAAALKPPESPPLKAPADFTLVGRPLPAKNLASIVKAEAVYGLDVRVPGMLVAVIERSPKVNGRVARVDDRAARRQPGVVGVVTLRGTTFPTLNYVRDGVAVVARSTWAAMQGRRQLKVTWNDAWASSRARNGALASSPSLAEDFRRALDGEKVPAPSVVHPAVTAVRHGSADAMAEAFRQAARTLTLEYDVPLQAHVPMEPMNAVAHWTPERCELWTPSHFQSRLQAAVCSLTGLPPERVVVHTPMLGGSFGRRLDPDFAIEAVMLSRELQRPVQVVWTREDDVRFGLYSPPSRHRVRVALGADGAILALDHAIAALSVLKQQEPEQITRDGVDNATAIDAVKFPYATGTLHVSHRLVEQAIRVFWWRRGYTPNNTFVNECVLDECARASGADPLDYRLRLLGAPRELKFANGEDSETIHTGRLAHVLREAARVAGWTTPLPAGRGRGLASTVTDSYVAQVVEVAADGAGFKVTRVVSVVDCGRVVNPQLVRAQVEGSVIFALTATLKGAITVENGEVQQSNFHDYPLLRIDETPVIETVLVESDAPPTGIGEPASHAVAAAVANAVFAATGKRERSLPLAKV